MWRMVLHEIGASIRAKREQLNLTQEAFAERARIPRRTLTRLEAGDPAVRIGTFAKAAQALGMTLHLSATLRARPTLDDLGDLYKEDDEVPAQPRARKTSP